MTQLSVHKSIFCKYSYFDEIIFTIQKHFSLISVLNIYSLNNTDSIKPEVLNKFSKSLTCTKVLGLA